MSSSTIGHIILIIALLFFAGQELSTLIQASDTQAQSYIK